MTLNRYAAVLLVISSSCSGVEVQHVSKQLQIHDRIPRATSSFSKANLTAVDLLSLASACKCSFQGVCSCEQAMEFMNCIADACDSGSCACESHHFMNACHSMGTTCPKAGLVCSEGKASCLGAVAVEAESLADVIGDLEELRQRKCELEESVKKGFFNGKLRLEELKPKISERLAVLKTKTGGKTLIMGCSKEDIAAFESGQAELIAEAEKAAAALTSTSKVPVVKEISEPEVAAVEPAPASSEGGYSKWYSSNVHNLLKADAVYIVLAIVLAFLYNQHRAKESHFFMPVPQFFRKHDKGFARGNELFNCTVDPKLCLFACCCPAIRWADTVDRAALSDRLKYWSSFFVMLILLVLSDHTFGIAYLALVILGVVFRQRLRDKFGIEHRTARSIFLDVLAWLFCTPCAIAQEAREEAHQKLPEFSA